MSIHLSETCSCVCYCEYLIAVCGLCVWRVVCRTCTAVVQWQQRRQWTLVVISCHSRHQLTWVFHRYTSTTRPVCTLYCNDDVALVCVWSVAMCEVCVCLCVAVDGRCVSINDVLAWLDALAVLRWAAPGGATTQHVTAINRHQLPAATATSDHTHRPHTLLTSWCYENCALP